MNAFITEVGGNGDARIFIPGRPHLLNAERRGNRWGRAEETKASRHVGMLAGLNLRNVKGYRFPRQALITSWPTYRTRRSWPDVGSWFPTTKALIDGLVDAGAWPDDNPDHIVGLLFEAPRLAGTDGLFLEVHSHDEDPKVRRMVA